MNGFSNNVPTRHLKLVYAESRGKVDLIKLILSVANAAYEDVQIKPTEWNAFAQYMPFEQLPVLLVDEHLKLAQPTVICRFLSRVYQLDGRADTDDSIMCDMIVEQLRELVDLAIQIGRPVTTPSENERVRPRQELLSELVNSLLPRTLSGYEKILGLNSRNKFIVGEKLTWADLALVNGWQWLEDMLGAGCGSLLSRYQLVRMHNEFVRGLVPVAAWFKTAKPLSFTKNV